MNLNAIVSGAISAVNPLIPLTIKVSTGSITNADGSRTPTYNVMNNVMGQMQALSYTDLMKLDGLNLSGERRKFYLNGQYDSLVRVDKKGGDLVITPDGNVWLIAIVLEYWPQWVSFAATLQDGS
jgi:hypothetical protein